MEVKRTDQTALTYGDKEIMQIDTEISKKAHLSIESSRTAPWHVYCSTTALVFIIKEEYMEWPN